jgi:thiol-disulfide isomerase/thioredoxin
MRYFAFLFVIVLALSATLLADDQIPDKALCSVCALKDGETESEKVNAHSEHDGKVYYFCSESCKIEFNADPVAYLPPVFPRPAPAFVVEMLEGKDKTLGDLKGKVVLVDFWATWCKPCLETMPQLQKLYSAYSTKGFEILGVSIDDDKDRVKKIKKMVDKMDISYPISVDAKQAPAWNQFKVKAIPAMYLLDGESQIVAQWTGKVDHQEVEKEVLRRLDKRSEVEGP